MWVGDFAAGLTAAVAQQAVQEVDQEDLFGTQIETLSNTWPYEDPRNDPFSDEYDPQAAA